MNSYPSERQAGRSCSADRKFAAYIIGVMACILLADGSAFGQIIVQPMKLTLPMMPGRRTIQEIYVENVSTSTTQSVDFRLVDVTQDPIGMWAPIEADADVVKDPNGATWATVIGYDDKPFRCDLAQLRSCQSWLRLGKDQMVIPPLQRLPLQLAVEVPSGMRGYYCAAIVARTMIGQQETEGITSSIMLEFVVPVIIEVQGRPMPQEIGIVDVGLEFRPQTMTEPAATLVSMTMANTGGTYSMLKGWARIWGSFGGHWRKLTDTEFRDATMIPGVRFCLTQDVGRALPRGRYKIEGFLLVDGARGDQISKEIEFNGDSRVTSLQVDAPLDLEQREVFVETMPGQQRTNILLVANASEEPVDVTVEVDIPDHLKLAVWENLRGPDFGCSDWVEVAPTQFTLRGYERKNLRIISRMPQGAADKSDYYAVIKLNSRHADGQPAGLTKVRVCVRNRRVDGTPRIEGMRLALSAPSSPNRYILTAQFGNFGSTHVQPTCRAYLTGSQDNQRYQEMLLTSELYDKTGILLPLESRNFTGILDVSGIPSGTYRLTAVLLHEKGAATQFQTALEVTVSEDRKTVRQLDVRDLGGTTEITLM